MRLYHSPASPNSRRVRAFIAEKGLDVPLYEIDLGAGEQRSDWYKVINPRLQVPALELDDGRVITEVPAIWRYLEESYPDTPLLGVNAADKGIVSMWERRVELDGFAPTMEGVRNSAASLKQRALSGPYDYEQIPELIDRSKRRVADFYADMDSRLEDVPFVAGGQFSVADITLLAMVDFASSGFCVQRIQNTHSRRCICVTTLVRRRVQTSQCAVITRNSPTRFTASTPNKAMPLSMSMAWMRSVAVMG